MEMEPDLFSCSLVALVVKLTANHYDTVILVKLSLALGPRTVTTLVDYFKPSKLCWNYKVSYIIKSDFRSRQVSKT